MKISVTGDFWRQANQVRTQLKGEALSDLTDLPPDFNDDLAAWHVRFRKFDRRRYLLLFHPASGMGFAIAGIRKQDLADPAQLIHKWLEEGLLAMGLSQARVAAYLEDEHYDFYNGGNRSQVSRNNALLRYFYFSDMDLARPVRLELAKQSLYAQLYVAYHIRNKKYNRVLDMVIKSFFSAEEAAEIEVKRDFMGPANVYLADGSPALPVPGITVELELVTNSVIFGIPHGGAETEKYLPRVRRVLQVPLDSNLFQLNQAIQASLGLFAYHHYNFLPAATADAERPLLDIYCWDYPPDYPSLYGDLEEGPGKVMIKQVSDWSVSLRDILAMTDLIYYMYDFGDGWAYRLKLGQQLELPGFVCRLADGSGDPPPVDVGGLRGWENFVDAISRPDSEEGQDMLAWSKIVYWTPFDLAEIQQRLIKLNYLGGEYWGEQLPDL